jgi:DNA polymerase III alpha subunit
MLAHKLGKNISLDEGNALRKILVKKGTGEIDEKKENIRKRFIGGATSKGLTRGSADGLWANFEYFSGYGFNKSHAVSYSILSYQCAWLLNYYPEEWIVSFLDKEPEDRKEKAISLAKSFGFKIHPVDINKSGVNWEIDTGDKTLVQPLTAIKGLGEKAVEQIINHRPFNTVEELLFNEEIVYGKLNKKALDVLCRAGALSSLVDERFSGTKHFWSAAIVDRPKSMKKFLSNLEAYEPEGDFSNEEVIEHLSSLTGVYPIHLVVDDHIIKKLNDNYIPPLGEWDNDLKVAWFIPREVIRKKTKNGKDYWVVKVVDTSNKITYIKCWGVKPEKDRIYLNRPYMARLDYNEQWGFSCRSIEWKFKLLG